MDRPAGRRGRDLVLTCRRGSLCHMDGRTKIGRPRLALLALIVLIAIEGCGGRPDVEATRASSPAPTAAGSVSPTTHIIISLGIYSGRPDPSWDLTDTQASEVVAAIAALPMATGTPPQGGLGYHGFTVVLRRPWPG